MKRALAIAVTSAALLFAPAALGQGFFFMEARPWADAMGTFGDAWVNLGLGYESDTWFATLGMGYPSTLSLMGHWSVQGAVKYAVTDRTTVAGGVTTTLWMESFQAWDLYLAPFIGWSWSWRPGMTVFVRANLPLYVYEDLPLLGMYFSFGFMVSPWADKPAGGP